MEKRNVTVTLDKAREWFNNGNEPLKEIALQVFSKEELTVFDFTRIKTFEDALTALEYTESTKVYIRNTINDISMYSKASAAMAQLNIIRKALNLGQGLSLTKGSSVWYPNNQFMTENSSYCRNEIESGKLEIIGKIKNEGVIYNVLGGSISFSIFDGVGDFDSRDGGGCATNQVGLLGCASREIAEHFGRYFGMLITEAKYGDLEDFVIVTY